MSIGDLNSAARGSGARFNTGKAPLELLPLRRVGEMLQQMEDGPAALAMVLLGRFQEGEGPEVLRQALFILTGGDFDGAANVFDFGRRKYAEFNWAKGMAWSVPIACAARHLLKEWAGVRADAESGLPHRDHVVCNLLMLVQFAEAFREGDDRPVQWLGTRSGDLEKCPFCGARTETPCDEPPPDTCEKALNATFALKGANLRWCDGCTPDNCSGCETGHAG